MDDYKLFLICTIPRSGSNFLWSLLYHTGYVGQNGENDASELFSKKYLQRYLDPIGVSSGDLLKCSDDIIRDVWRRMLEDTSKNGIWGAKLFLWDLKFFDKFISTHGIEWDDVKIIWLRRRDKLNHAISNVKARTKEVWFEIAELDGEDESLAVSSELIDESFVMCLRWDYAWKYFFDCFNLKYYEIFYEDFEDETHWELTVKDIFDFLEIDYELPLRVYSSLKKQSREWNQAVRDEFCSKILLNDGFSKIRASSTFVDFFWGDYV